MSIIKPLPAAGLLVLLSVVGCHAITCTFPTFMQARQHWESRVTMERRMTGQYIDVTATRMTTREYSAEGDSVITRDCLQQFTADKVLVELTVDDTKAYQCLEFVKRSASVAQIKQSQVQAEKTDALCDEDSLSLQPWLLVWPFIDETDDFVPSSLTGGYDMVVFDHQADTALCEEYYLKARWESDCQGPEGTLIDFRLFDCQGGLSMDTKQSLQCLGSWSEGSWEFSVMSSNDELWPRLWLLRHPTLESQASDENMTAKLLSDLVAETGDAITETQRIYTLTMTNKMFESLCEDEAEECGSDICEGPEGFYCQKTCEKCEALEETPRCQFYQVSKGEWLDIGMESTSDVRVATSMLYTDDLLPLQCMQLHTEQWYHGTGRKALVTVFKNGCRPRYNCVELIKRGWNILEYRLGQGVIWPHTEQLVAEHVCSDGSFADDPLPLGDRYRNQRRKYLVAKPLRTQRRTPMNCGVTGRFDMQISYKDGKQCSGTLDLCQTNTVRLNTNGCEDVPQRQTFTCIGTMVAGSDVYVMTESDSDTDDIHCWLFHQTEWMGKPNLVLTRPSECHAETATQVIYRNATSYIARVDFAREDVDIMTEECEDLPSTTTTTTTATTTTTTTTTTTPTTTTTTTTTQPTTTTTTTTTTTAPTTRALPTEAPTTKTPTTNQPSTTRRPTLRDVTTSLYVTPKPQAVGDGGAGRPGSGSVAISLVLAVVAILHRG